MLEKPSSDGTFSPISGARSVIDLKLDCVGGFQEIIPDTDQIADGPARFFFPCISAVLPPLLEGGGGLNEGRSSRTLGEATRYRGRQTANISLTLSPAPRKLSNGIHFISLRQTLSA